MTPHPLAVAVLAGLTGVVVHAELDARWGGFGEDTATVGPEVEFSTADAADMLRVQLDFSDATLSLTVVNRTPGSDLNPDGVADLGLRSLRIWGLVDGEGPLSSAALLASSFPRGSFGDLTLSQGTLSWNAPALIMPGRGTQWQASWALHHER